MEECAQVYNMLMELFTQMHAILGDAPVSTERYIAVLQEGLSTYEVGVIPTTADQVLFGSLGRTRARSVSALFVLGAVEGVFPAQVRDGGMIDDEELAELSALGLPRAPFEQGTHGQGACGCLRCGRAPEPASVPFLSARRGGGGCSPLRPDRQDHGDVPGHKDADGHCARAARFGGDGLFAARGAPAYRRGRGRL